MIHPMLAAHIHNRPWALWPGSAEALVDGVRAFSPALMEELARAKANVAALYPGEGRTDFRPYDVIAGTGVAVVPIKGILFHGCDWGWWGLSTYDLVLQCFRAALDDPEVKAIALHIDSPGGEVAGCFDLADVIFAARGTKPIWAVLDESAYSAAYALACAADRVIVPRTGGTGSIGVVTMHLDITGMLEQAGIKITTVQFGDRKTDSYPTTPLRDDARKALQGDVDVMGEMFVDMVARNRGLGASAVRGTQAGTFLGQAGVSAGLADAVMSPEEAFKSLIASLA